MRSYDWILSVLDDLNDFAEKQELLAIAAAVREAKNVAVIELYQIEQARKELFK